MEQKQPQLEQKLQLKQKSKRLDRDLIIKYIGREIVLELGEIEENVCSGFLEKYDGRRLDIINFKQHDCPLSSVLDKCRAKYDDLTSPDSVEYSLPRRTISEGIIASIQSLEDVLNAREEIIEKYKK